MRSGVTLTSWRLDPEWDPLRQPVRDPAIRRPEFEDSYDFATVLFDLFWDERGENIIGVCPPLLNLEEALDLRFRALPSGAPCGFRIVRRNLTDRLVLTPPPGTTALLLESRAARLHLAPQPNLAAEFAGRRALFTLSKDNDLAWLRDWAQFYVRNHGCDAVVVYDNGSTRYGTADIAETLRRVPGIERALAIDWPFPYGAFDLRSSPAIQRCDSIYCQWGCFEHARLRLFPHAASVSNADVDELVVSASGESVFDAAERSADGVIWYPGIWIECPPEDVTEAVRRAPRHRHFTKRTAIPDSCPGKWTVAPGRVGREVQWEVHQVRGTPNLPALDFAFRHIKPINTNWDVDAPGQERLRTNAALNPDAVVVDELLRAAYARAFPDEEEETGLTPRPGDASDTVWRLRAGRLLAAGAPEAALAAASQAVALAPGHASHALYRAKLHRLLGDEAEAEDEEARAAALRENSVHYQFQMGYERVARGDVAGGLAQQRRAILADPARADYATNLMRHLHRQGAVPEAFEVHALVAPHCPPEAAYRLDQAHVELLLGARQNAEALALAREVFEAQPRNLAALGRLIRALMQDGQKEAALAAVERGLVLQAEPATQEDLLAASVGNSPESVAYDEGERLPDLLQAKAWILLELGRAAEAAAILRARIAAEPRNPRHRTLLATALDALGAAGEARDAREQALALLRAWLAMRPRTDLMVHQRDIVWAEQLKAAAELEQALGRHEAALALLDEAVEALPDEPDPRLRRMVSRREAGRLAEATADQRRVVAMMPWQAEHRATLAALLLKEGDLAAAEAELAAGFALAEARPAPLYAVRSDLRERQGRPEEALADAKRAVEADPESWQHAVRLAYALMRRGRLAEAEDALARAAGLGPQRPAAVAAAESELRSQQDRPEEALAANAAAIAAEPEEWHHQARAGRLLMRLGRLEAAEAALAAAIALRPANPGPVHALLSELHLRQDRPEAALAESRAAMAAEQDEWRHAHRTAHVLLRLGRLDEAEEAARSGLALDSAEPGPLQALLGDLAERAGRPDAALAAFRAAIAAEPGDGRHWHRAARLLIRLGRADEAEEGLRQALALGVAGPGPLHAALGELRERLDQPEAALAAYRAASAAEPEEGRHQRRAARMLLRLGRADEALAPAEQALALIPDEASSHALLGEVLLRLDRFDAAAEAFARALATEPRHPPILSGYGTALHRLGRPEAAVAAYRAALAAEPENGPLWRSFARFLHQLPPAAEAEAAAAASRALALMPGDAPCLRILREIAARRDAARAGSPPQRRGRGAAPQGTAG